MGQTNGAPARIERVDVVAAEAALHFRKAGGNLVRLAQPECQELLRQGAPAGIVDAGGIGRDLAEVHWHAVGEHGLDRDDVVARGAVAERAVAAGVITDHAADGGAGRGGDIDREPQTVRIQLPVEIIKHDTRFDRAAPARDVELEDAAEMLRAIEHEAAIDRLAAL